MIYKDVPLIPNSVVRHIDGLTYQIEDVRKSTSGYETSHQLANNIVNYTQLEDGTYPAGTKWCKPEDEFREYFTIVDLNTPDQK